MKAALHDLNGLAAGPFKNAPDKPITQLDTNARHATCIAAILRSFPAVEDTLSTLKDRRDLIRPKPGPAARVHAWGARERESRNLPRIPRDANHATRVRHGRGDSRSAAKAPKRSRERICDRAKHGLAKLQDREVRKDRRHKAFEVKLARLNEVAE